jgi:hypothetical protein
MADIRNNIEAMWKPLASVEFKNQTVTASDLASLPLMITSISFVNCRSNEWIEICQKIAVLQQLKTLSV